LDTKRYVLLGLVLALASAIPSFAVGQQTPLDREDFNKAILELYESKKLTSPDSYEVLRDLNARLFETEHQNEIETAFGDQTEKINAWFAEHPTIKSELFNAIDPSVDDVAKALEIFKTLFETYPDHIVPYSELAIATAIVWDNKKGVYDYSRHQRRAKASMPDGRLDGIEGFKFLVDAEPFMEGRIKYVPWEFLKHVSRTTT